MFEIYVPIDHFLSYALRASLRRDYIAFMLLIARSADGVALQDELLDHWESFDDLTSDQILVITAGSITTRRQTYVQHRWEPAGIVSPGLAFGHRTNRDWDDQFWLAGDVSPRTMGRYAPMRYQSKEEMRAAFTGYATRAARFFGISEKLLPCTVILSLRDRRLFVISPTRAFSLYNFVRLLLIEFEPTLETVNSGKMRLLSTEDTLRDLREQLDHTEREIERQARKAQNMKADYEAQIRCVCETLRRASTHCSKATTTTSSLIEWLGGFRASVREVRAKAETLISLLKSEAATGRFPEFLAARIESRLPRAIAKRTGAAHGRGFIAELREARKEHRRMEMQREALRSEVTSTKEQMARLKTKLARTKDTAGFSDAIIETARKEGMVVRNLDIRLPYALSGWSASVINEMKPAGIRTCSGKRYDVALSFAGEDRSVAREIAQGLQDKGLHVFYDEFEKYNLWGKNLFDYLSKVYFSEANYCVMLVSENYVKKVWTDLERQAMQARALVSKSEYLLPVRLDDTDVTGLLPTIACLDLAVEGTAGVVNAIVKKCRTA